jgi:ABC-type bacteriocin/lantibiotic exporter with double-glycine peptidase domain
MKISQYQKHHHQHHDQSDCGVVCLKSVLSYYGGYIATEKLRLMSGTNKFGTTMFGLLNCAKELGFTAEAFEADIKGLQKCTDICVLHVVVNGLQHFVVCYGYNAKKATFLIGDPAQKKPHYLSAEELNTLWISKALIRISSPPRGSLEARPQHWKWLTESLKEDTNILLMSVFLGVLIAIINMAFAVFSQKFIDTLLPTHTVTIILYGCLLLFFLLLLSPFLEIIQQTFLLRQAKNYNIRIVDFFLGKLIRLNKSFFDSRSIGDMVARMNDTSRIQKTISSLTGSLIVQVLTLLVAVGTIFIYDQLAGFIAASVIPLFILVALYYHPKIRASQRKMMTSYSRNESNYINTIRGIETIKITNSETHFLSIAREIYSDFYTKLYQLGTIGIQYQFINRLISVLLVIG